MIFFNRFIGIIGLYHLVNGFRGIQYQIYKHPIMKNTIGVVRSSSNDKLNEEIQIDFELIEPSTRSLDPPEYEGNKRNEILAVLSSAVGIALFTFSQSQSAVSGVALLKAMERDSPAIEKVICNGRPTIIDFYAPWCESCREVAPTMRYIEKIHESDLNVVTLDGTNSKNGDLVSKFKVDGIPHLAFLNSRADALTSLVGAVPKELLLQESDALAKGKNDLPILGYDPFKNELSHSPFADQQQMCKVMNDS